MLKRIDLTRDFAKHKDAYMEAIEKVCEETAFSGGKYADQFDREFAQFCGVKAATGVNNGTSALQAAMLALGVGPGDEVIVPANTYIATAWGVTYTGATPVFVDCTADTWEIDPSKIEEKITSHTRAILPVHILGLPCDMERIMKIAAKHNLLVVEDACQAWLAEINGKKVGTFGKAGCFSFQNSKNMAMGEGGAIISDDDAFMDRCYSYHNYGNPHGTTAGQIGAGTVMIGTKLRITEYQAAIGLAQLKRLEAETELRNKNATYLQSLIGDIPGISPYKLYKNVTKAAYHLFPFRYHKEYFKGLSRAEFLKALQAEGIPCSAGYSELNKMPYLKNAFESKYFQKFYPTERLNYEKYAQANKCPLNEKLCNEEAVWISKSLLLSSKSDLDKIAGAIEKIQKHAELIVAKTK